MRPPYRLQTGFSRRHAGRLAFVVGAVLTLSAVQGDWAGAAGQSGEMAVPRFHILELTVHADLPDDVNPWVHYPFHVVLTDPNGRSRSLDFFYDGPAADSSRGHAWRVRMCPDVIGQWTWNVVNADARFSKIAELSGSFACISSAALGGLVSNGRLFQRRNGQPTYLQGNFLDFRDGLPSTHVLLSPKVSSQVRRKVIDRQQRDHAANKINCYLANRGDYGGAQVIPWIENQAPDADLRFDRLFWLEADRLMLELHRRGLFAEVWFFADDSGFGDMPLNLKTQVYRYAMARLSAFSHTLFVIALEWDEEWRFEDVAASGRFIQDHNPWGRPLSVHGLELFPQGILPAVFDTFGWWYRPAWPFSGQSWATFIASQAGNDASAAQVNRLAIRMGQEKIPHISEEFGILKQESDFRLRSNMWANFCGGAAGAGTGSDIRALVEFITWSRLPLDRMQPANHLVEGGGQKRFCLAEPGHHYLIYSLEGDFKALIEAERLRATWLSPRGPVLQLGEFFEIERAGRLHFMPPSRDEDWVLWISDGSHPTDLALAADTNMSLVEQVVN